MSLFCEYVILAIHPRASEVTKQAWFSQNVRLMQRTHWAAALVNYSVLNPGFLKLASPGEKLKANQRPWVLTVALSDRFSQTVLDCRAE